MRLPDFMIAGAPKCGTTALYRYLQTHPRVFLSDPKEPHFFAEDLAAHREVTDRNNYLRLFEKVSPEHLAVGEASVWSMHSSGALAKIKEEIPEMRLVILLRHPVDFVKSLHSDLVWICFDNEHDFQRAWELSAQRRQGRLIPALCQVPWFLDYERVGRLGEHVQRMLTVFPRDQVKILLFDDLCQSPQRVYEEVLSFLGVPSDGRNDFARFNAGKQNRSQWLAACRALVVRSLPRPIVNLGKRVGLGHVSQAVMRLNSQPANQRPMDETFRQNLLEVFRDDILSLSETIGRKLDRWLV